MNRRYPHWLMKTITALILCSWVAIGCSSEPETEAQRQARWAQGKLSSWEIENGIGPFASDTEIPPIDAAKAELGKQIFIQKCATCHTLDFKKTGPQLRDVTKKRTELYVLNQILNPEQMGKLHPSGKQLVAQYAQYMTIQGITRDDAFALLDFLRSQATQPSLPMEQQPGFGVPAPPVATQ